SERERTCVIPVPDTVKTPLAYDALPSAPPTLASTQGGGTEAEPTETPAEAASATARAILTGLEREMIIESSVARQDSVSAGEGAGLVGGSGPRDHRGGVKVRCRQRRTLPPWLGASGGSSAEL